MSIPAKSHACITKCTILLKKWIYLLGYMMQTKELNFRPDQNVGKSECIILRQSFLSLEA